MTEEQERYEARARAQHADPSDDTIEIDDNPAVHVNPEGAWVAAWVWVTKE